MSEDQTNATITLGSAVSSTAAAPTPEAPKPRPLAQPAKPDAGGYYLGTGRRKTAVARVRIKPGEGKFLINGREVTQFFTELRDQQAVVEPLKVTKTDQALNVLAQVHGGGFTGQAGAVRLGISRALKNYDPTLESALRDHGMLTRDPRKVERKKYGRAGARRRFQFSKR